MSMLMLAFLLVPVLIFCGIGYRERARTTSFATFFQYGGKFSRFHFFATLTSSTAGLASTLLLMAVYGYFYGLGVFIWIVIFWWLTQWGSQRVILRVEKLHPGFWKNRGTLHEFLGLAFGSKSVRVTAATLTIICYTLLLVAEVILSYRLVFAATQGGDGPVVSFPLSGFPVAVHVGILVAVFFYIAAAGFRAVIRTDSIQFTIVGLMILTILCFLGARVPEMIGLHQEIFGSTIWHSMLNPVARDPLDFIFFFVIMNLFFWVAWWPVAMDQWHRCAATASVEIPTDKALGTASYGARAFVLLLAASVVLIGAATRVYVAPGAEIADPLPVFVRSIMPGGVLAAQNTVVAVLITGIVLMGLMAAVLSTLDTYVIVVVQSLLVDIVIARRSGTTLAEADKSEELVNRYLPKARILVGIWLPVVAGGVWVVSRITLDAFNMVYMAFSFQMAFVGVLLVALFRKGRGRGTPAIVSLLLGGIWCAATFPILIGKLDRAILDGNLDKMYSLLDMMFANTVLVAVVAALGYAMVWLFSRGRTEVPPASENGVG